MKERYILFPRGFRRTVGEDHRTRLELADAKGNFGGSYRKREESGKLDLTAFIRNVTRESFTLGSNGQNDHKASISTVEEVLKGKGLNVEIIRIAFSDASDEDIKNRAKFEKNRVLKYIGDGEELTMAMRKYAVRKGIPLPKAVMHHTR